jgi:hypothetical protein
MYIYMLNFDSPGLESHKLLKMHLNLNICHSYIYEAKLDLFCVQIVYANGIVWHRAHHGAVQILACSDNNFRVYGIGAVCPKFKSRLLENKWKQISKSLVEVWLQR